MAEKYLWLVGSSIYILLASLHLLYTFFTNKFSIRDKATEEMMKNTFPILTKKTTVWSAWIGFNGSHSIGGVFFGVINLFLAFSYFEMLGNSVFLLLFTCLISGFYLFLGIKYWFVIPRTGILVSTICFVAATIIILTK